MGDAVRLTGKGSAIAVRSSASALLHTLSTRHSAGEAPYVNQARATYPGGVYELDAALHLPHPPEEDLELGTVTTFPEGASKGPPRPHPTNPLYNGTRLTFPAYAVVCDAFPREPA